MSTTALQGRTAAIIETLQRTEWQASTLQDRIMAARVRQDVAELERLQAVAESCAESAGQYRRELEGLTGQCALNFGGSK